MSNKLQTVEWTWTDWVIDHKDTKTQRHEDTKTRRHEDTKKKVLGVFVVHFLANEKSPAKFAGLWFVFNTSG